MTLKRHLSTAFVGIFAVAAVPLFAGTRTALAWTDCDVPVPPPICRIGEEDPEIPSDPYGSFASIEQPSPSLVRLGGWAIDPDTTAPIVVHVYSDGAFLKAATANLSSGVEILDGSTSAQGEGHSFDVAVPAVKGTHMFCVYGINVGPGGDSALGCKTFAVGGAPSAPTLVRVGARQLAVDSGYTAFVVVRDQADDETEFVVWKQTGSGIWTLAATRPARWGIGSEIDVLLDGVAPGTSHCFFVDAANRWGQSASTQSCFTVPPLPPLAPSNLAVTGRTQSTISVSWQDNSLDEDGFTIPSRNVTVGASSTAATVTGLTPHTTYCFSLVGFKIIDPFGRIESQRIAFPCVKTDGPPAAPTGLSVGLSGNALSLAWVDAADNERGFRIQRGTQQGTGWTDAVTLPANSTGYAGLVASILPGAGFCYRVVAFNDYGSAASASRCRGIALISMSANGNRGFGFESFVAGYPDGARVEYVKNVSYTITQKRKADSERAYDLDLANASHQNSVVPLLTRAQTTHAFDGLPLNGQWAATATNVYGFQLHDGCTTTTIDDWYRYCTDHADVVLEAGWSS